MTRATRRIVLVFVAAVTLGLLVVYFHTRPLVFWALVVLTILDVAIWFSLAVAELVNRVRFGTRMSLDEILNERDPLRTVQRLRYHLGWSPGRIAAELNQRKITNDGLPWYENDVRRFLEQ